jgi:Domain of unknown function (DUF4190)
MQCRNHSALAAVDRCTGCAEPFCPDCLVEILGQKYCGDCKIMALKGTPLYLEEGTIPCPEASEALTFAIISLFCFGFITGPMAISKALKARSRMAQDSDLTGSGKATAAIIIGMLSSGFWLLAMLSGLASKK